ncbi:MAG: 23S rRNA (pseudouridine(1915)-N(3))-methyltransferase RlmH [Flavobacteriales bacterium]|jgi:23S rRNA (pseudouridine1915-N3)-methyltransferase|nr:23S rRNA (pseudouridine(1915)-N(3))-methyltransferase RlmH [Flavobacteriales bacterium]
MQIKLIVVGKTNKKYLIEGELEYEKRLKHYIRFEEEVIPELKKAKHLSESEIKEKEGKLILNKLNNADYLVLLDENGKAYHSIGFSQFIQKQLNSGVRKVVFVVGGAYGFSEEVYRRANSKIALSPMTFSHQMVRLFFKEQLYRGFTILKNEPYHHR